MERTTHSYKAGTDFELKADVFPCEGEGLRPIVLWLHGGALIMGSRESVHPLLRRELQLRGYLQVSIDYRLAPETRLPEILDDVQDALDWIRVHLPREYPVDPDRIGVIGRSAGGYLALTTGYRGRPP